MVCRGKSRSGLLTASHKAFTDKVAKKFGIVSNQMIPAVAGLDLEELGKNGPEGDWPLGQAVP